MIAEPLPSRARPRTAHEVATETGDTASELFAKLLATPRPVSEPHTLVARGVEVGTLVFQVLIARDLGYVLAQANSAAVKLLGDDGRGTLAFEEAYLEQKALHIIAAACRQPKDPRFPTFSTAQDVRDNLTDAEAGVLLAAYNLYCVETSPAQALVSRDESGALLELVAKRGRLVLARYTAEALADVVVYAAQALHAPQEAPASPEPPEATPETKDPPEGSQAPE